MFVPHTLPNMLLRDISRNVVILVVSVLVGRQLLECTCVGPMNKKGPRADRGRDLEKNELEATVVMFQKVKMNPTEIILNPVTLESRNFWRRYGT